MSARDQSNYLLNKAIDFALKLIANHGSHVPFAIVLHDDGKDGMVAVDDSETNDPNVLLATLLHELSAMCERNELRAVAFARNVEYRSAADGSHVDAIQIDLDHMRESAVTCMLPYSLRGPGEPVPGELFATEPRQTFFSQEQKKRAAGVYAIELSDEWVEVPSTDSDQRIFQSRSRDAALIISQLRIESAPDDLEHIAAGLAQTHEKREEVEAGPIEQLPDGSAFALHRPGLSLKCVVTPRQILNLTVTSETLSEEARKAILAEVQAGLW